MKKRLPKWAWVLIYLFALIIAAVVIPNLLIITGLVPACALIDSLCV